MSRLISKNQNGNVIPDHSKIIKYARKSGGSRNIFNAIFNNNNDDYYNGTFKIGGNTLNNDTPTERDLVNLYFTGEDKAFKTYDGPQPIIKGDTIKYKQYIGNILPMDTLILRPESKEAIKWYNENKMPLIFESGAMANPSIINDIRYQKYSGKQIDDVGKAGIYFKQDANGNYYADIIDVYNYDNLSLIKNKVDRIIENDGYDKNGPYILRQEIPIKFTRKGESDGGLLDAISEGLWQLKLDEVNKKQYGGTLSQQRAAENQRHSTLAKHYVQHPTLLNLTKAGYHWFKSKPELGGQPENDYIYKTGIAPGVGLKGVPSPEAIKKAEAIATGTKFVGPSANVTKTIKNAEALEKGTQGTVKRLTKRNLTNSLEIQNLRQYEAFETPFNKIARKLYMTDDQAKSSEYLRQIENLITRFKNGL